jgi:hypothetical protein
MRSLKWLDVIDKTVCEPRYSIALYPFRRFAGMTLTPLMMESHMTTRAG